MIPEARGLVIGLLAALLMWAMVAVVVVVVF